MVGSIPPKSDATSRSVKPKPIGRRPVPPVVAAQAMVKRQATTANVSRRHKLARVYTAWHPVLVVLLERVLPAGWYQCLSELQLAREPLRIDVVIVRRSRRGAPPPPRLLASVVGDLADHTLVHFKGPTDELERDDARMLFAYALQYLVVAEIEAPSLVALRVVAPRITPRFVEALRSLGCELTSTAAGMHEGRLGVFPLRVIETIPVNGRAGEHLLYTVTPGMLADPGGIPALDNEEIEVFWALREHVEQLRHPLPGVRRRHMKDENKVVESFEQALARLVARLPPEQRLMGLTEAQAVLALPDATLRGISSEYIATLPKETRAAIQRRIGGAAAAARAPTRGRKQR
jgi:hypothetical protein